MGGRLSRFWSVRPSTPAQREQVTFQVAKNRMSELRENPYFVEYEKSIEREFNSRDTSFESNILQAGSRIIDAQTHPSTLPPVRGDASATSAFLARKRTTTGLKEEELRAVVIGSATFDLAPDHIAALQKYLGAWYIHSVLDPSGEMLHFSSWYPDDESNQTNPSSSQPISSKKSFR